MSQADLWLCGNLKVPVVETQTEPSAVILSSIHAGSLRYYAGRATMRFDLLDEA